MKIDLINPVRSKLRPTPGFRIRVLDNRGMFTAAAFDVAGFSTDSDSIELLNRARFCGRCLDPKNCACRWSGSDEVECMYTCNEDDGQCKSCREYDRSGRFFADPPSDLFEEDLEIFVGPQEWTGKHNKSGHDSRRVRLRVTRRRAARRNAGKRCA